MTSTPSQVWFISGCSTGIGRALAMECLSRGLRVAVTARDVSSAEDIVNGHQDRALTLPLDVTKPEQIANAVAAARHHFGRIDVLVNNSGYGYQAAVEEGLEDEIRAQFEVNVFGLFALTRAVLPVMRAQRNGHIINITSVAGLIGYAGSGYYAASKHAIEGWSDSLQAECEPLGIHVTCVEPGPFRTDWAGRSLKQTPSTIADYAATAAKRMGQVARADRRQPGDPVRAAQAMIAIAHTEKPPRHLVLGSIGIEAVTKKLNERLAEIESWRATSVGADFEA